MHDRNLRQKHRAAHKEKGGEGAPLLFLGEEKEGGLQRAAATAAISWPASISSISWARQAGRWGARRRSKHARPKHPIMTGKTG